MSVKLSVKAEKSNEIDKKQGIIYNDSMRNIDINHYFPVMNSS